MDLRSKVAGGRWRRVHWSATQKTALRLGSSSWPDSDGKTWSVKHGKLWHFFFASLFVSAERKHVRTMEPLVLWSCLSSSAYAEAFATLDILQARAVTPASMDRILSLATTDSTSHSWSSCLKPSQILKCWGDLEPDKVVVSAENGHIFASSEKKLLYCSTALCDC